MWYKQVIGVAVLTVIMLYFAVLLIAFLIRRSRRAEATDIEFEFGPSIECPLGKAVSMVTADVLVVGRRRKVTARFVHQGQERAIDGAPEWRSSDESIATVTPIPNEDGTPSRQAWVRSLGQASPTIEVSADVRLGDGVNRLTRFFIQPCVLPEASDVAFEFGEEEDAPTA